jgi:Fe2+ or Zn2+ uptake regulation protein
MSSARRTIPGPLYRRFQEKCRAERLPVTAQRRAIFEALAGRTDHPSAEDVFLEARRLLPEVSRATVYRTLETFARRGIVGLAHHAGPVARFDGRIDHHHHLVCRRCGAIADVDGRAIARLPLPDARGSGFEIESYSIQFEGTCASCRDGRPRGGRPRARRKHWEMHSKEEDPWHR